jgi:predicted phage terminase large subunit-like protein
MSDLDLVNAYRAELREDFCAFVVRCFLELNPGSELAMNGHIEVMASRLSAVADGLIRRLIINVPPRHLKSLIGSVAYPAWCLGRDPSLSIICVSYAQDLADKLARDCRRIMMSDWYRELFPETRLVAQRPALQELITTAGGFRFATSVGGALTGRGADLLTIDDPTKPADAMSEKSREATNEWFDHTLLSRLNDQQRGAIVLIMQRLHEDDLTGHVLRQQEDWEVVRFPAIAEADEVHHYITPSGPRTFCRKKGEALHPDRQPLELLEKRRRDMGTYVFAGQYQQTPAPAGGGLVKIDWFHRYEPHQKPDRFDRIVQSWDTANKASELSDYSVCTTWGIKQQKLFLLHVLRKQLEYPDLKRAVREQQQLHSAGIVLIEDKASGTQLIQDLIREGLAAVTQYKPEGDKIMRMHAQTAVIEHGFVYLPAAAPWLDDYLHELAVFPNGRHHDQVDSTAQFLDWFKTPIPNSGIYEFYREQAEKVKHPERFRVRLELPPGDSSSHVWTRSGVNAVVQPDRSVEMSEADAAPLIRLGWKKLATWYVNDGDG